MLILKMSILTILTGKNCVLLNSVQEWLLLTFFICLHNQILYIPLSRMKQYRCLKNVIHQKDSENEWLILSASFTAKFGWFLS